MDKCHGVESEYLSSNLKWFVPEQVRSQSGQHMGVSFEHTDFCFMWALRVNFMLLVKPVMSAVQQEVQRT